MNDKLLTNSLKLIHVNKDIQEITNLFEVIIVLMS